MNRITVAIAILVLLPRYHLHSTSLMAFGTGNLEPLISDYLNDDNNNKLMFLWLFHPQNYGLQNLPSGFQVGYFMVLSDRQIEFLTTTSLKKEPFIENLSQYLNKIKNESKELLKDEVEFVVMVFLFQQFAGPNKERTFGGSLAIDYNFIEGCQEGISSIYGKSGVEERINKVTKFDLENLKKLLFKKKIDENAIRNQYLPLSSALFYTIDALEILSSQGAFITKNNITILNKLEEDNDDRIIKNSKETSENPKIKEYKATEECASNISEDQSEDEITQNQANVIKKLNHLVVHLSRKSFLIYKNYKDIVIKGYFGLIQEALRSDSLQTLIDNPNLDTENSDSELDIFLKKTMKHNKESDFYSYIHPEKNQDTVVQKKLSDWEQGFVEALSSDSVNENLELDNSNKNILKKVIFKLLLPLNFQKIKTKPHKIDDIAHRRYYAYSVVSEPLILMIQEISKRLQNSLEGVYIIKLFTLISEILEDYLTFYPCLLENDLELAFKNFAHSLLEKVMNSRIDFSAASPNYKENKEIAFRCVVLFAMTGILDLENSPSIVHQVEPHIIALSLLNYPLVQNPDVFIEVISEIISSDVASVFLFYNNLSRSDYDCQKIFKAKAVDNDGSIESCQKMKENLKEKIKNKNSEKTEKVII